MRHDHLMRHFLELIQGEIEDGALSVRAAAERMRRHLVPLPVALRIVRAAAR